MRASPLRFRFLAQAIFLALAAFGFVNAAPRDEDWKTVDEARKQDQPQTAVGLLSSIEKAAFTDGAWSEGARALATRIALEAKVEDGDEDTAAPIKKLEAAIETSPEKTRPVLRVLATYWLSGYYREHKSDFVDRSITSGPTNLDIETWDLARILSEIDARWQSNLADAAALKKIPVADFADLFSKGELGDAVRPTLYDFAANCALEFYASNEVAASHPASAFSFTADSPALGTAEEFLAWQPELGDVTEPKSRALKLLQDLLTFHRNDADKSAFLAADLNRLCWAGQAAGEEGREKRLEQALRRFTEANAARAVSAMARVQLANILKRRDAFKEAHLILREGAAAFPEHPFGKLCALEIASLERSELHLEADTHWTPAGDGIRVEYRNLKRLWFRLYPAKYVPGKSEPDADRLRSLVKRRPDRQWEQALRDEGDYKQCEMKIPAPADLPAGYYYLVASAREDFSENDNELAISAVHVTSLAIVGAATRDGSIEGAVVDAVSGLPIAGVDVTVWKEKPEGEGMIKVAGKTGDDGRFAIPAHAGNSFIAVAQRGNERAVLDGNNYYGDDEEDPMKKRRGVVFFTDRAIYRPGQTVHFKGIWCEIDRARGRYSVLADRKGTVVMRDNNDKELAKLTVKSNQFGSFSGTFTAAEGGSLHGACTIKLEGEEGGGSFRVEEYKRPKFFTELDPPQEAAVLGKQVTVKVRAESYTGAAVDGAKVSWRVSRGSEFPGWWRWNWAGSSPRGLGQEEISHGEALTDASGAANISFIAKPDPAIREEAEPVFVYTVTASVTDRSGETRTGTKLVRVARTSLRADLTTEEWLEAGKKLEIQVLTTSLDGEGRPAKGSLKIHRLKEPATCPRWSGQDWGDEKDPAALSSDPDDWKLGEEVDELAVETNKEGKATLSRPLKAGAYRLIFTTKDANGREVRAMRGIQVVAPDSKDFTTMMPFYTVPPKAEVEPGQDAEYFWGSGYPQARACVEWRIDGQLLKREWSEEGRTQQVFRLPVKEDYRGGITVTVWQVALNRLMKSQERIEVPWTSKHLKLRWEHLVSKLQPGTQETWTAVVETPDGEAATAEMVATLYDASLDAFTQHSFDSLEDLLRSESNGYSYLSFGNGWESLNSCSSFKPSDLAEPGPPFRNFREELEIFQGGRYSASPVYSMASSAFIGGGTFGRHRTNADFIGSVTGASIPGVPASRGVNVTDIVTGGLRSGDGAINRNNIDAVLNNPNRTAGVFDSGATPDQPDLTQVAARANLQETAFFMPTLSSAGDGKLRMTFTMPEALTKWRFIGLAHDKRMRSGILEGETVTAKDLMVQPNPPRFLREGDELWFTVKISNQGDKPQAGTARLDLTDAATEADKNAALGIAAPEQPFSVAAKESVTLKWRIAIPDGAGFLRYKATASTGGLSDGEEGWLPVIPRRILLTESMAMPIREAGKKDFEFTK
uniref:alpha-2-macroglobulin family protein n=1 Tax=Haloferula sp. BvORR071 TaxID=1396141 RepID=UPI00055201CA